MRTVRTNAQRSPEATATPNTSISERRDVAIKTLVAALEAERGQDESHEHEERQEHGQTVVRFLHLHQGMLYRSSHPRLGTPALRRDDRTGEVGSATKAVARPGPTGTAREAKGKWGTPRLSDEVRPGSHRVHASADQVVWRDSGSVRAARIRFISRAHCHCEIESGFPWFLRHLINACATQLHPPVSPSSRDSFTAVTRTLLTPARCSPAKPPGSSPTTGERHA